MLDREEIEAVLRDRPTPVGGASWLLGATETALADVLCAYSELLEEHLKLAGLYETACSANDRRNNKKKKKKKIRKLRERNLDLWEALTMNQGGAVTHVLPFTEKAEEADAH